MSLLRVGIAKGGVTGGTVVVHHSLSSGVAGSADTTRAHGLSTTLDLALASSDVPCLLTSAAQQWKRCLSKGTGKSGSRPANALYAMARTDARDGASVVAGCVVRMNT